MKRPIPEFSRPLQVDRIPKLGSHEKIAATQSELNALKERLGLSALTNLTAHLKAEPWRGGGVRLTGEVECGVEQISVVSLEAFPSQQKFSIERFFLPPKDIDPNSEEVIDIIDHGFIDLGEIATETLALELDPYPRKEGEVFIPPSDLEVDSEAEATLSRLALELSKIKKN